MKQAGLNMSRPLQETRRANRAKAPGRQASGDRDASPTYVVEASHPALGANLRALWDYRDLLYMLALRDIKVRYQHTAVGAAWALLQPLFIMLVLTAFATIVGAKTGPVPYPLYLMSGLVPWTYFTHAFVSTTNSLASQSEIIGKIYFPRLVVPVAATLAGAIDFLMAALLLPLFMAAYGAAPTWALAALPAFVIMALAAAFALGLWLAVLNVRYRDVVNALPFFTQLLFFATPVAYNSQSIPQPWRTLAGVNPMVGVVDGFRWALLGDKAGGLHLSTLVSMGSILLMLVSGLWYFRRREPTLADEL